MDKLTKFLFTGNVIARMIKVFLFAGISAMLLFEIFFIPLVLMELVPLDVALYAGAGCGIGAGIANAILSGVFV